VISTVFTTRARRLPSRAVQAAVGFSTHSGWAVAVTAGVGDDGHLHVVDRRRVTLIDDDVPRQAYHAAKALDPDAAEALVARVEASIVARAHATLGELIAHAGDGPVIGVAVVGEPRAIPEVAVVLASHARMHACEGEQYRRGITEAADDLGLAVLRLGPAVLAPRVTELLGWTPEAMQQELAAVRAALGPPWQSDHKEAALAAVAMVARSRSGSGGVADPPGS
jgi:hypothetical protein